MFVSFISGAESVITGWAIITVSARGNGCWLGMIRHLSAGGRSAKVGLAPAFCLSFLGIWDEGRGGKGEICQQNGMSPRVKAAFPEARIQWVFLIHSLAMGASFQPLDPLPKSHR